jgi:L-threonylcarbamoyladenylate synthase
VSAKGTVAIRIPAHDFCKALIKAFGKPIVSTSANISGAAAAPAYEHIADEIKQHVDCIVSEEYDTSTYKQASRLINILPDGTIEYLR